MPNVSSSMRLAVVIVNWNTCELLDRCLSALECELAACKVGSEIWVVDNASSDGSVAMVKSCHPAVRLINNAKNLGFARANNLAIVQAAGEYLLLLNSDTEVVAGALGDLMTFMEEHPRAGVVGPRLVNPNGSYQAGPGCFPTLTSTLLEAWGLIQLVTRNRYYPSAPPGESNVTRACDWVGGACLLARREAIDQVGLLDENFFMNSEEVDWCYRFKQKGWQVWYDPRATIVHLGGASASRSNSAQRKRNYRGKVLFLQKHVGGLASSVAEINFRFSSLLKAFGYAARFLAKRHSPDRQSAVSHWEVAREAW